MQHQAGDLHRAGDRPPVVPSRLCCETHTECKAQSRGALIRVHARTCPATGAGWPPTAQPSARQCRAATQTAVAGRLPSRALLPRRRCQRPTAAHRLPPIPTGKNREGTWGGGYAIAAHASEQGIAPFVFARRRLARLRAGTLSVALLPRKTPGQSSSPPLSRATDDQRTLAARASASPTSRSMRSTRACG